MMRWIIGGAIVVGVGTFVLVLCAFIVGDEGDNHTHPRG